MINSKKKYNKNAWKSLRFFKEKKKRNIKYVRNIDKYSGRFLRKLETSVFFFQFTSMVPHISQNLTAIQCIC